MCCYVTARTLDYTVRQIFKKNHSHLNFILFDCLIWLCLYTVIYICISMGGQLDENFLPVSLPHKYILIVTLITCFVVNKFLSLFSQ